MLSTRKQDWASFFVALLLWQHLGCLASPTTFVLPHLAGLGLGALGGSVKVTIGPSPGTPSIQGEAEMLLSDSAIDCLVKHLVTHERFTDLAWMAMVYDTAYSAMETSPRAYVATQWFDYNRDVLGSFDRDSVSNHIDGAMQAYKSAADACSVPLSIPAEHQQDVTARLGRRLALFGSATFTSVGWGLAIGAVSTMLTVGAVAAAVALSPVAVPALAIAAAGFAGGVWLTPVIETFLEKQAVKIDPEIANVVGTKEYEISKSAGELIAKTK